MKPIQERQQEMKQTWKNFENELFESQLWHGVRVLRTHDDERKSAANYHKWCILLQTVFALCYIGDEYYWISVLCLFSPFIGYRANQRSDTQKMKLYIFITMLNSAGILIHMVLLRCDINACYYGTRLYTLVISSFFIVFSLNGCYFARLCNDAIQFNLTKEVEKIMQRTGRIRSLLFLTRAKDATVQKSAFKVMLELCSIEDEGLRMKLVNEGVLDVIVRIILPAPVNLQILLCNLFMKLSSVELNRPYFVQDHILAPMKTLLERDNPRTILLLTHTLAYVSMIEDKSNLLKATWIVPKMVELCSSSNPEVLDYASATISNMLISDNLDYITQVGLAVIESNGLEPLLALGHSNNPETVNTIARTLSYMCLSESLRIKLMTFPIENEIIKWSKMADTFPDIPYQASRVVASLSLSVHAYVTSFLDKGFLSLVLDSFLESNDSRTVNQACLAIRHLASNRATKPFVMKPAVKEKLQAMIYQNSSGIDEAAQAALVELS
eukprot:TRINITY_DN12875_c0_g1_i5.p1 TRINITY_DN12875_c0_g1~~TRINITY_DN12875_c0_g1_i5.p1  ORF type:complete len:498 (+),score=86.49 TRINITY_DN12875_c0_g1_i5:550-2043(+)